MKSSSFLQETNGIAELLFSATAGIGRNRLFELRAGETLTISAPADDEYLYLFRGEVEVATADDNTVLSESGEYTARAFELYGSDGRITLTACDDSVIYHVDGKRLDDVLTWAEIAHMLADDPEKLSVLARVLQSRSLSNLPVETVFELMSRMKLRQVEEDEVVLDQGSEAENFYILQQGEAEVWSLGLYDDEPQLVGRLKAGDSFGEDALVSGGTRNATVKMLTDGMLLVGEGKDFRELVARPSIEEIDADITLAMMDKEQYQLLDVRYEEEHEESHIAGSQLIPLHELRSRVDELDADKKYITYCLSGKRSAVAALILKQRKYNVVCMQGGLNQWPHETSSLY